MTLHVRPWMDFAASRACQRQRPSRKRAEALRVGFNAGRDVLAGGRANDPDDAHEMAPPLIQGEREVVTLSRGLLSGAVRDYPHLVSLSTIAT